MSNTSISCSRPARKILDYLVELGIEINLPKDRFDLEIDVCLKYYPNHVLGVIEKVMGNKSSSHQALKSLSQAQDEGWPYFQKPCDSMLGRRTSALYKPYYPVKNPIWARSVYSIVVATFCRVDFSREDAVLLLTKLPHMVHDQYALFDAFEVCRKQNQNNIAYLHGVCSRAEQERRANRERERSEKLFEGGSSTNITKDELNGRWRDSQGWSS